MRTLALLAALPALALAQDAAALIQKGDALDAQLKTREALAVYLEAEKLQPADAALLHRIAKQYGESQNDVATKAEKKAFGEKALDYAKRAVAADPKNAKAQLALAISYGRLAAFLDNKTKIAYSRLVKEHVDRSIALDPKDDLAWHVRGAWEFELANLNAVLRAIAGLIYGSVPRASNEEAVRCFEKAIELNPRRVGNHVELGRALAELGQKDEARAALQKGLSLPDRQRDDPETKGRARAALAKLK
ncbi:MAG: tetratricopeptide repeat protein [Chthoniobacteraceae bacterium]